MRIWLVVLAFLLDSALPVWAQDECENMRQEGTGLAARAMKAADEYDKLAKSFNASLKQANRTRRANGDIVAAWAAVIHDRDALRSANQATLAALSNLHTFNLRYATAGCVPVSVSAINEEYSQSTEPFRKNLQRLNGIPDQFQDYEPQGDSQSEECQALAAQVKQQDEAGRNFAQQYDPLIAQYDTKYSQLLLIPDHTKPVYAKLRGEALRARDAALPGVRKYPAIIQTMFNLTMARNKAGCILLDEGKIAEYQKNNDLILDEIAQEERQMEQFENLFPTPPSPAPKPQGDALVRLDDTAPEPSTHEIRIRNASTSILCLFVSGREEPVCNLFPGQLRVLHVDKVRVFGGGYWGNDGHYQSLGVCRDFYPIEGDTVQDVRSGIESSCRAPIKNSSIK